MSSKTSPFRELCILYFGFTAQVVINMAYVLMVTVALGILVLAKHGDNVLILFRQCTADVETTDTKFNKAVVYHQQLLEFISYYNSSMRAIFSIFFILQLIITVILLIALKTVIFVVTRRLKYSVKYLLQTHRSSVLLFLIYFITMSIICSAGQCGVNSVNICNFCFKNLMGTS